MEIHSLWSFWRCCLLYWGRYVKKVRVMADLWSCCSSCGSYSCMSQFCMWCKNSIDNFECYRNSKMTTILFWTCWGSLLWLLTGNTHFVQPCVGLGVLLFLLPHLPFKSHNFWKWGWPHTVSKCSLNTISIIFLWFLCRLTWEWTVLTSVSPRRITSILNSPPRTAVAMKEIFTSTMSPVWNVTGDIGIYLEWWLVSLSSVENMSLLNASLFYRFSHKPNLIIFTMKELIPCEAHEPSIGIDVCPKHDRWRSWILLSWCEHTIQEVQWWMIIVCPDLPLLQLVLGDVSAEYPKDLKCTIEHFWKGWRS